ncbi:hypothetical protein CONLIGDRAFT_583125 [Coniochaeta ligniaria NRRL 30616]|uniref:Uncharacterized protein n=1 Tax=Coniochaeta ligniaria NRRL 30616 TaxID=1408157 RepID=A0A1J7ID00_9PEZI|nr:hypothetical protein CONLIGDRAFT_583125 [Coniochaeta ligniaria NRRL 30616]
MQSKAFIIAAIMAFAEARFGQEGSVQASIQALSAFGNPGEAPTLAGQTPGVLLAGANACAKLVLADQIVAALGNDPQVLAGAAELVAAEKNFNPSAQSIPTLCSDATLPATAELRGIVPLVDPAVLGSDVENANSAASLKAPFDATGLSVADVVKAQGFSNFTAQAAA